MEIGMQFTAGRSGALDRGCLPRTSSSFITPEEFMLSMNADDLNQAVRRIVGRPLKIKIVAGQSAASASAAAPAKAQKAPENETSARALANPEVQKFQEVFGGQIRTVRNLKE